VLDDSVRTIDAAQRVHHEQPAAGGYTLRNRCERAGHAQAPDLYGKTGTTNDSMDAWFAGYQPTLALPSPGLATTHPENWASRETGGGLSLPVWIEFMAHRLKTVPVMEPAVPEGVINSGGEWYFSEYAPGSGISPVWGS
jgi:penicillin-binding protein 1A